MIHSYSLNGYRKEKQLRDAYRRRIALSSQLRQKEIVVYRSRMAELRSKLETTSKELEKAEEKRKNVQQSTSQHLGSQKKKVIFTLLFLNFMCQCIVNSLLH